MTDQNLTEIVCIVDRSGSMGSIRNDAIGGFNTFLEDQQKVKGRCLLTFVQFDDIYEKVHDGVDIQKVPKLTDETYQPRGSTALFDAVGKTINEVGARLASTPEDKRPGKVLVVILTDGHENASHEFNRQQIFDMVKVQRDTFSWEFIFLGAGIDAFDAGQQIGIFLCQTVNHDSLGMRKGYSSMSCAASQYRATGHVSQDDLDNDLNKSLTSSSSSNSNPVH
jgi:hypothetical protein